MLLAWGRRARQSVGHKAREGGLGGDVGRSEVHERLGIAHAAPEVPVRRGQTVLVVTENSPVRSIARLASRRFDDSAAFHERRYEPGVREPAIDRAAGWHHHQPRFGRDALALKNARYH